METPSQFFLHNKHLFYLNKFNYIHGANGSGKTMMLNTISQNFNSPIFDPNINDESKMEEFRELLGMVDRNRLTYYFQSLWESKDSYSINSASGNAEMSILYIAASIALQELEKYPFLLIDNIYWDSFDSFISTNIVETLDELNSPIVVTGYTDTSLKLVKSKAKNPNIITL